MSPPHRKPAATPVPAAAPAAAAGSHALRFPQLEREIQGRAGESVFNNARRGGVRIVGACGGRGTCGSCMVRVTHGEFARLGEEPATPVTQSRRKWQRACQIVALGDCDIEVSGRSLAPVVRAELADASQVEMLPLDAAVHDLELERAGGDARRSARGLRPTECGGRRDLHASTSPPRAAFPGCCVTGAGRCMRASATAS